MGIKKQPPKLSKEELYNMYIINEYSIKDIVKQVNYSEYHINKWLDCYEIPKRSLQESKRTEKYKNKYSGENHYTFKQNREGY